MTDKQLKERIKKLWVFLIIIFILIIALSIYTLYSKKADLSIYANDGSDNLQGLGINEEEFKEYLSIFGNLIYENLDDNQKKLNMATDFVENMYPAYEVQTNENGLKFYDADLINGVAKELQGIYIKDKIDGGKSYTYNSENNTYVKNEALPEIPYCIGIDDISRNDDKIEVTYKLAKMTNEQLAEYSTGQNVDFRKYTVKATIMENKEYNFAKYFVSSIEKT